MTTIHFATGNPHKVEETRSALSDVDVDVQQVTVDIHEIDAADTADVARRKARDSFAELDIDTMLLVDDSGLYIDALDGFPGSHASFFQEQCGNQGILRLMEGRSNRDAYFKTSMAVYQPDTDTVTVLSGTCEGRISREERGNDGFAYDPIFIPEGRETTFAEDHAYKEKISHRTKVTEKFVDWLETTVRPS